MKTITEEDLIEAFRRYQEIRIGYLTRDAAAAYISGDLSAQRILGAGIALDLVHQDALDFARVYRADLVERGGSVIKGEFIPWLESADRTGRERIYEIIETGIREGRATGVKEHARGGGYPPGSVADELQAYFSQRKSHASAVARTETRRIEARGARNRYTEHGVALLQWLCGPNPCDECAPFCGQIFPIRDAPEHPVHPNCVCDYRPYFE